MLVRFPFRLRHCIDSQMNTSQLSKFRVRVELGNGGSWVLYCVKLGQQAGGLIQCVGFSAFGHRPYVKHAHVNMHTCMHTHVHTQRTRQQIRIAAKTKTGALIVQPQGQVFYFATFDIFRCCLLCLTV